MISAINSIKNTTFYDIFPQKKHNLSGNYSCDSISFSGTYAAERKILAPYLKRLKQASDVFKISEYIASGAEGSVFKFNDCDFCIKIPHQVGVFGKWRSRLSQGEKANHVVAASDKGAVIMKYLPGTNISKKPDAIYMLPNSSYRKLLKQISDAYKSGLIFDAAGSNVIFNPAKKTLTAIDFAPNEVTLGVSGNNPFARVYNALSCVGPNVNPHADENNRRLMGKLLTVLMEELQSNKPSKLKIDSADIDYLFSKYETKPELIEPCENLNKMISEIFQLKEDKTIKPEILNNKIQQVKEIIKQNFPV